MKILVIGGTRFVGRTIVESALDAGHEVTVFHRGQSGSSLFEGRVTRVLGDRVEDLNKLEDMAFDAVFDTCGYKPGQVRAAAEFLKDRANWYLFVSTISVYDGAKSVVDRPLPLFDPLWDDVAAVDGETYGPLKVACEEAIHTSWPEDNWTILRPGLIVGPHDHTHRFPYWLARLDEGDPVVAPDDDDAPIQVIDVADLAAFSIRCIEEELAGIYNVVGPENKFREMVEAAARICGAEDRVRWVDPSQLEAQGVTWWSDLPLYVGPDPAEWALMQLSADSAIAAGLKRRPVEETMKRTLDWWRIERKSKPLSTGWSMEREAEFLASIEP